MLELVGAWVPELELELAGGVVAGLELEPLVGATVAGLELELVGAEVAGLELEPPEGPDDELDDEPDDVEPEPFDPARGSVYC